MKRLKMLFGVFAVALGISALSLNAAAIQVPVVHQAWTFIGVTGFQQLSGASACGTGWDSGDTIIADCTDGHDANCLQAGLEVPTWDYNASNQAVTPTNWYTPVLSTDNMTFGTGVYGTVGLMVIDNINGDSTDQAAISYSAITKDFESPIRTMYITTDSSLLEPNIKIQYQALYEGEKFYLRLGTTSSDDNETYEGTFSRQYTWDDSAVLGSDFNLWTAASAGSSGISGVIEAFDMNLSDNNWSNLDDMDTAANSSPIRGWLDGNLTVITWDAATQDWQVARWQGTGTYSTSEAAGDSANDFSIFVPGKGYWVKLDRTGGANYNDPSGFILGEASSTIDYSSLTQTHSTYGTESYSLADGWNMLAFGDEYLRHSATGAIVTPNGTNTDINITDTYGAVTISVKLSNGSAEVNCTTFNQQLENNATWWNTQMRIKCLPTNNGEMILLSDRKFYVNYATAPTNLIGTALQTVAVDTNGTVTYPYATEYGEYALVVQPNPLWGSEIGTDGNMTIICPEQSYSDGGDTTITGTAATDAPNIETELDSCVGTSATGKAYAVDMNYSGTTNAVLMAADQRFGVRDHTMVRVYNYDSDNADIKILGSGNDNGTADNNSTFTIVGTTSNTGVVLVDDELNTTVAYINQAGTDVNATKLDGEDSNVSFMIWSPTATYPDLQEHGSPQGDVFTEVYTDSNGTYKGAISNVWQVSDIAGADAPYNSTTGISDGNYTLAEWDTPATTDLKYHVVYVENFPNSGPLYSLNTADVKPELFITGQTEATSGSYTSLGGFISWKSIDVTRQPETWYDAENEYDLFWTEKEKGYWVYLDGSAEADQITIASEIYMPTNGVVHHFNNTITSFRATTNNHLKWRLDVNLSNVPDYDGSVTTTDANDAIEVFATINGKRTNMLPSNALSTNTRNFTMSLQDYEVSGVQDIKDSSSDKYITITAVDGLGHTTTSTLLMDYTKPTIDSLSFAGTTYTLNVTDATSAKMYINDINDSVGGNNDEDSNVSYATVSAGVATIDVSTVSGLSFPTGISTTVLYDTTSYDTISEQLTQGLVNDLRFVSIDENDLYSNQYQSYYAAVYAGTSILSDSDTTWDSTPNVYNASGENNTSGYQTYWDTITGTTGQEYDTGVQLKTVTSGDAILIAYKTEDNAKLSSDTVTTANINVAGTTVGAVSWVSLYDNDVFYVYYDSKLYVGFFDSRSGQDIEIQEMTGVTQTIVKQ
jgi:hypothetical protein